MSLPSANNKNPTVTVGLAANLPNPVSVTEGTIYYASDTDTLYVLSISTAGIRSWGISGGNIVNSPVDIFANPTTGSDSNPGTASLPVQTLKQALILATVNRSTVSTTIHLAAGTYAQPADEVLSIPFPLPGALPLEIIGATQDSGFGTLTATGGTAGSLVTPSAGTITGAFTNHALKQQYGLWLPGSVNAGNRFVVQDNSAGTITIVGQFPLGAPVNNDAFTIGTPSSIISNTASSSLSFVGGPVRLNTLEFLINSAGFTQSFEGVVWGNQSIQENGVTYLVAAGASGRLSRACPVTSGASLYISPFSSAPENPCGCIYDGSASVSALFLDRGTYPMRFFGTSTLLNTVMWSLTSGTVSCQLRSSFMTASGILATDGARFSAIGTICTAIIPPTALLGVGPGCMTARNGSVLDINFMNVTASGVGGVPIFSLDQSKGSFATVNGANAAASKVLTLHKGSTAEVSTITATDSSAGSTATVGGTATVTISGAVAQTTDNGAGTPELCMVGAPT